MEFNLMSTDTVYPNINIVFDDSLYAVSDDTVFVCSVGQRFNSEITFPSYAESIKIGGTPTSFNHPFNIPNSVTNVYGLFSGCSNFNQPISIPNNVENCGNMFVSCINYNQPVTMPDSVLACPNMFRSCSNFNSPVTMSENVYNCQGMFYGCSNFNQPINMGNNVTDFSNGLRQCINFNQSVNMSDSVTNLFYAFEGCRNLSSPFKLSNNLIDISSAFANCYYLDQNFNFSEGLKLCISAFYSCTMFNSSVVIPPTVNNTYQMFSNVNSCQYNFMNGRFNTTPTYQALRSPIYFFANSILVGGAMSMFANCNSVSELYITGITNNYQLNQFIRSNGINRCNIYTDDASLALLRTTPMLVGGTKPTWTSDTANGCIYNTTANIYIYNNWDGTLPTI